MPRNPQQTVEAVRGERARHRVLVVGAGSIGERHIRCLSATGRADVSFFEPREEVRAQVATRYDGVAPRSSWEEALHEGIDCAVIATPAPLHVSQAIELATLGCHLLIEKPLSLSMDGIDELLACVARERLTAAVAYVYREHPSLAAMRAAIDSGRFGRVVEVVAVSGQNFPHYRPAYRQTYYADRSAGGGAIQDALTHLIDAGQFLAGPITRVVADAAHQVLEGVDVEDTVHVLTRQRHALGSYTLNQHQAPNETTITVICERGTARFEYHNNRWMWMQKPVQPWHAEPAGALERDTLFIRQANAFLGAVEGKTPPLCTLEEGVAAVKVNLAILNSMEQHAWQEIA